MLTAMLRSLLSLALCVMVCVGCRGAFVFRGAPPAEENKPEAAVQEYNKAIAELGKEPKKNARPLAQAYDGKGTVCMLDDPREAIACYSKAIELDPSNAQYYWNRGRAYGKMGMDDKAEKDLARAMKLTPRKDKEKQAQAHLNRALFYVDHGDCARALSDINRAAELTPASRTVLNLKGQCNLAQGNYAKAAADFSKMLELGEADGAYRDRGDAYQFLGHYDKAFADYSRSSAPGKAKGFAYYRINNYALAASHLAAAPKDADAILVRYLACRRLLARPNVRPAEANRDYAQRMCGCEGAEENAKELARSSGAEIYRAVARHVLSLDKTTEEKVLEQARAARSPDKAKQDLCTAYYYLGEARRLNGDAGGGRDRHLKSVRTGVIACREYLLAKAQLERVKVRSDQQPPVIKLAENVTTTADTGAYIRFEVSDNLGLGDVTFDGRPATPYLYESVVENGREAVIGYYSEYAKVRSATQTYVVRAGDAAGNQATAKGSIVKAAGQASMK